MKMLFIMLMLSSLVLPAAAKKTYAQLLQEASRTLKEVNGELKGSTEIKEAQKTLYKARQELAKQIAAKDKNLAALKQTLIKQWKAHQQAPADKNKKSSYYKTLKLLRIYFVDKVSTKLQYSQLYGQWAAAAYQLDLQKLEIVKGHDIATAQAYAVLIEALHKLRVK